MKIKKILQLSIVLLAIAIAYSNHFMNPFHFDDAHTVESNMMIRDIGNTGKFFTDASTFSSNPSNQSYRPLVTFSFAVDYFFGKGLNPLYFHLDMFIIFLCQIIIMFLFYNFLKKMVQPDKKALLWILLMLAWFGLHTANAETLNYISARSDLYSTFFVILGFVIYFYFPSLRKWQVYLIPVAIGMLAKEQAAMFAPLLFFYILFFEIELDIPGVFRKKNLTLLKKAVLRSLPAFIVCGAMSVFIIRMQPDSFQPSDIPVYNYLITQPWVYLRYFIAFFLPVNLSADSDWVALNSIFDERAIIGLTFIAILLVLAIRSSRSKIWKPVSFGILWFLLALIPTSSFIPLAEVTNDHRMFFPFVGLVLSVVWSAYLLVDSIVKKVKSPGMIKISAITVFTLILAGNAYGVYQRNKVWSSDEKLWYDVTLKSPQNARGLMNYGLTQLRKGNYPVAKEYFTRALLIKPYYPYLYINMGVLQRSMGNIAEAESSYKKAIQYGPGLYLSHYYYASFLTEQNRNAEAVGYAETTLQLSPNYLQNRHLLANIYIKLNETQKLKMLLQETLRLFPDDAETKELMKLGSTGLPLPVQLALQKAQSVPTAENYLNLSLEYYNNRMFAECIDACQQSLKIKPDYAMAYNNICSAYNSLGEWDKAIEAGEKALAIDPNYTLAANNLALARKNKSK
ncbi:MAG TPA: tetratricopeptide repeat protein [Bacteroidales bacterium]|nr:tetratricopeptide repeat protein [Bacteroidales bacterium]